MSITYNWNIANTEYNTADGGVLIAHWRCTAQDGDFTASSYGTCSFTPDPQAPDFVPYESLTQDIVLGWIWDNGVDKDGIEEALANKIEAQKNPTTAAGVPWTNA